VRFDSDFSAKRERIVVGNPSEQTTLCSCEQFNRAGMLCSHVLKILDEMNIMLLLGHYVLKRWTRESRYGTIQDNKGRSIFENLKLDALLHDKTMSHKFLNLAYQAASFLECCLLVDNAFCLGKQIEEKNQCIYKYSV
jgi:hypothetical protein